MFNLSFRGIIAVVIGIATISIYFLFENPANSNSDKGQKGLIVYYSPVFKNYNKDNSEDYRYLSISTYPFIFEIKTQGQQKSVDRLSLGKSVTLFYKQNTENSHGINKSIDKIEFNGKVIYQRKSYGKLITGIIFCCSFLLLIPA